MLVEPGSTTDHSISPALASFLDRGIAFFGGQRILGINIASERQGAVANHIDFGPDTLNDGRVNFIIIALAPGDRIIGMKMNN
jgi:hypothetical protein